MELRVLRYFLAVAREESITAAARNLHVTQPTLSRQLMELEEELGKKLFVRGGRRMTLTDEGMFLKKRAQEIVDLADKTEAAIKADDEIVEGDVYIGGGETLGMKYVAKAIREMRASCPGIRFHLHSGNGEDITERLDKGLLDFGLFVGSADFKKYDYIVLPEADSWGLLLKSSSPLAEKDFISPEDLEGLPLLFSRQSMLQNELTGWLGKSVDSLNIIGTYNLIYNAAIMVKEGLCGAVSIDGLINTAGDSGLCFKRFRPGLSAGLAVAWKKYQVFSKAAEKFLETLQRQLG
jgi:DNA-binding transcriptional LysR family regulator